MKKFLLVVAYLAIVMDISIAQTWTPTGAATNSWQCIASSADGSRLIAGQYAGSIEISTNGGATWTTNAMTNGFWTSVASSADGTKMLAAAAYEDNSHINGVFTTTNFGASWLTNGLPTMYWGSVALSGDGNTMAAVAPANQDFISVGAVFCSTNSGNNWVSNHIGGDSFGVAMSADGRKIFVVSPEQFWRSTNSGANWMQVTGAPPSYSSVSPSQYIASSSDGNKLVMAVSGLDIGPSQLPNQLFTSTNSGDTWNLASAVSNYWDFVASSADGKTLMASGVGLSESPLYVYVSTNSGISWTSNSAPAVSWSSVACSADGGKLFATAQSSLIYSAQFIKPPWINDVSVNGALTLSWLVPSTNFILQQSPDLSNWTEATNVPVLNLSNLQNEVTLQRTNNSGFYRLKMH